MTEPSEAIEAKAVDRLRLLAMRGATTDEILEHSVSCLSIFFSPVPLYATLFKAFDVPLRTMRDHVEGWVELEGPDSGTPTPVVAEVIRPYVEAYVELASR